MVGLEDLRSEVDRQFGVAGHLGVIDGRDSGLLCIFGILQGRDGRKWS